MGNKKSILTSWSFRRKLLLLLLLIFLPAFGFIVASGLKQRRQEMAKAQDRAWLLVQSLAVQQEQVASSTKVMLTVLARAPAVQRLDTDACNRLLEKYNIACRSLPYWGQPPLTAGFLPLPDPSFSAPICQSANIFGMPCGRLIFLSGNTL